MLAPAAREPHCGVDAHVISRALILHTVQTRVVTTGLDRDEHVTSTHLPDHVAVSIHDRQLAIRPREEDVRDVIQASARNVGQGSDNLPLLLFDAATVGWTE